MDSLKATKLKCPECGHENHQDSKFCSSCGIKLRLICPSCGSEKEIGDRFCRQCGYALADHDERAVDNANISALDSSRAQSVEEKQFVGERRSVTVLFADAKGFTPMSEKLNEEQVYNIMQGFIDIMVDIINENGGTVTQFLGDGLMALFGAPIAHENSSVKAVSAALKMQSILEKHAIEVNNSYGADCHFRIGLNTGPVVVGRISDSLDMDYTALGNTVNLAARMQQMAEPGTVYISSYTYKQVRNYFNTRANRHFADDFKYLNWT
jgi:class 3 adenylate cyclase